MSEPEFLERDAVLFLHDQALREYGGTQGIRNEGLLDSALSRPVNRFHYEAAAIGLLDLAASYAFGVAKNHPFLDGNKRTAWASCVLFLLANGASVTIDPADVVGRMLDLVENRLDEVGFADWLKSGFPKGDCPLAGSRGSASGRPACDQFGEAIEDRIAVRQNSANSAAVANDFWVPLRVTDSAA